MEMTMRWKTKTEKKVGPAVSQRDLTGGIRIFFAMDGSCELT